MQPLLPYRILKRELGEQSPSGSVRELYGDRTWIDNLDIVNELGGHSGCVNALCWSRSGRLLASGSDDKYVNIHSYLPDDSTAPFKLTTSLSTGHTANIFGVKFMPHSNDNTLVTCAGDGDVRVFDLEYAGSSTVDDNPELAARRRQLNNVDQGVRYLSEGSTNGRVYRSHADRAKRIVTESSPHLFLTCSEDGEVRQWDLRQPSSAYPPPRSGRGFRAPRGPDVDDDDNVPPPLISYKRYRLDLNTISCSASQPHYIALGGAHLHCFLHDRRMLGRDVGRERGSRGGSNRRGMDQATRCVRRFAPNGVKRMKRTDSGHITACKISDAYPNEMVVSWSHNDIYSFDLVRSPGVQEDEDKEASSETLKSGRGEGRARESRVRKRKRDKAGSEGSGEERRSGSRQRQSETESDLALRVRYQNGQSEEIPIEGSSSVAPEGSGQHQHRGAMARQTTLGHPERRAFHIARAVLNIRRELFGLQSRESTTDGSSNSQHASEDTSAFAAALKLAYLYLPVIRDGVTSWGYPLNPTPQEVSLQESMRRNREATWRFVEAAGTLARVLGGSLTTEGNGDLFSSITSAPNELAPLDRSSSFRYAFLKAILAWLDGGREKMLQMFRQSPGDRRSTTGRPVPADMGLDAIDAIVIPYLLEMAGEHPIRYTDPTRYEHDEGQTVFASERAAVVAFSNAIQMPFREEEDDDTEGESNSTENQSRRAAIRFWGFKVGRGLLMRLGEELGSGLIMEAFGGLEEMTEEEMQAMEIDEEEEEVGGDSEVEVIEVEDDSDEVMQEDEDDEEDDTDDENEDDDDDDDDEDEDEQSPLFWTSSHGRNKLSEQVEINVPCDPHTRVYRGHCNVETVKDVNFFGLDDEYVVSGSDSGHVFIWDKHSTEVVNILEGDEDVVNVIQGHPYEPMMAVSGIDHTVKIFGCDQRDQWDARHGINLARQGYTGRSSLGFARLGRRRPGTDVSTNRQRQGGMNGNNEDVGRDDDALERDIASIPATNGGIASKRRLHMSYEIISQNDERRRGGRREATISRAMLARIAARIRAQEQTNAGGVGAANGNGNGGGVGPGGEGGIEGNTILLSDLEAMGIVMDQDCLTHPPW
ncbi:MAG: hypothetical protein M1823_001447 [Watsoniomyces obsoletus]|nr:MAG: hypothetical protein M1823_001447 [Watsoniomyces obsoletus]